MSNLTHTARCLNSSVKPSRSEWKFLLSVYFSSWIVSLLVSGCCPSLYVTLWTLHDSYAFQGSAKQTLLSFVGCSQGLRLKDLCSNDLPTFTKGFLNGSTVGFEWCTTQNQPHQISNTQRTENKTTDVVIQQHGRKLLMMGILMSETCWVHKKWNKIASDIKLVFHSSTIITMHGPINIRLECLLRGHSVCV